MYNFLSIFFFKFVICKRIIILFAVIVSLIVWTNTLFAKWY